MTPEQLARSGTEEAHQTALFCWAALEAQRRPELRLLFAIPNGGLRNKITAAKLKAQGVRAGVPDLFLPVKRGPWSGMFIELKKPAGNDKAAGRPSADQKVWIDGLRRQGFAACIAVGWEQGAATLIAYLDWKG